MKHGLRIVRENRIVKTWVDDSQYPKRYYFQGKRVPKDFPLTYAERRAYVESGIGSCIRLVRERTLLPLREVVEITRAATGPWKEY